MSQGFQLSWLSLIRKLSSSPPPIFQWMMGFSGGFMRIVGPEALGGRGDFLRSLQDNASALESEQSITGAVIQIPGMPTTYDWEQFPQSIGPKAAKVLAAERLMARYT
jgi:hypothetical protein